MHRLVLLALSVQLVAATSYLPDQIALDQIAPDYIAAPQPHPDQQAPSQLGPMQPSSTPMSIARIALAQTLPDPSAPVLTLANLTLPLQAAPDQTLTPLLVQSSQTNWAGVLGSYVKFCQTSAKPQYYVDCLSERFAYTAAQMDPYNRSTADLRKALQTAARDLSAITAKYHTPDAGEATPHAKNITPTRALRAIAPQNRTAANAAGTKVLDTAQLVLLRSANRNPAQALAFTRVAEVLGTAKVLLRSA